MYETIEKLCLIKRKRKFAVVTAGRDRTMHDIIMAVVGCGLLNIIATAIINALGNRKSRLKAVETKLDEIEKKLTKTEKDELRTQLLLLLSDYPDNDEGIMTLAKHYFGDLHGNWYATSLFNTWLETRGKGKPEWFKEE